MIIASVLKCLGIVAIVVVAGINILFLTAWAVLLWIASGESDVNGDPERDGGLLEPHAPSRAEEVRSPKSEGGKRNHGLHGLHGFKKTE